MRRGRWVLSAVVVAATAAGVRGDVLLHAREGVLDGQLRPVAGDESQVEINLYWSKHPKATYGTTRVDQTLVRRTLVRKRPQEEYFDRRLALAPGDAAGHLELARWCKKNRRRHATHWHAQRALIAAPRTPRSTTPPGASWVAAEPGAS